MLLKKPAKWVFSLCLFITTSQSTLAQNSVREVPYFTFGKGLGIISPDSMYLMNIRFRMQNRIALNTVSENNLNINEVEARIRRLRLRFDGYMFDPRISYVIQLSFSRGDLDFQNTGFPNIIRDAMVYYAASPKFKLGIGQTKLPGNRQRINSSGDLQFADRSIVNSRFNVDRDFGVQFIYTENIGDFYTIFRGALTTGEGRNFNTTDAGLAYTGRIEFLPLGLFQKNGNYFEGDLMREPKPKVSLGITASHNEDASRVGGTIGAFLYDQRDITTYMSDFLLKYKGFALASELLIRQCPNPITINPDDNDVSYVLTGLGYNIQSSYLFKNNYEIALRYSIIDPSGQLNNYEYDHTQYQVGISKYLRGHRLKLQSDLAYDQQLGIHVNTPDKNHWIWRFQVELGI